MCLKQYSRQAHLLVLPLSVTLTGVNAVFDDEPMTYLLSGGRIKATTTVRIQIEYDTPQPVESVSVCADWRFPYPQIATVFVSC